MAARAPAANAVAAVAPTFSLLLVSRVAAGSLAAISTPVALATAAQLAPPDRKGRALSVTIGGVSVAWVIGVPLGAVIVDYFGWRASFALAALVLVGGSLGDHLGRRRVFAAGDVRYGSVKRVASAVGAGAIAIQSVHEYLASHAGVVSGSGLAPMNTGG